MPPGSKKRKAAKRKKEKGINLDSPTNSQGNGGKVDDQMSNDGKESDNSESASPTSQECSAQNYLVDDERDCSQLDIDKPMEGSENGDTGSKGDGFLAKTEGEVVVDREMEGERDGVLSSATTDSKIENINIEHVRSDKESQDEPSVEESRLIVSTTERELEKSSSDPHPVEQGTSFSEEVTQVIDYPVENPVSLDVVDPPFKETGEKVEPSLETHTEKTKDGGECSKVIENPESLENEPQITLAPQVGHPTSWWCCCGLFDVLMGSHR